MKWKINMEQHARSWESLPDGLGWGKSELENGERLKKSEMLGSCICRAEDVIEHDSSEPSCLICFTISLAGEQGPGMQGTQ